MDESTWAHIRERRRLPAGGLKREALDIAAKADAVAFG